MTFTTFAFKKTAKNPFEVNTSMNRLHTVIIVSYSEQAAMDFGRDVRVFVNFSSHGTKGKQRCGPESKKIANKSGLLTIPILSV
jgi:hypothetical protein